MDAYVYQADLFCKDCAKEIKADLDAKSAEDTGDSDDYPQGPYSQGGGESDTPQHCGGCDMFLENPLTTDGMQYVLEALDSGGSGEQSVLLEWADFYGLAGPVEIKSGKRYVDGVRVGEIGSISTGTVRTYDLVKAGLKELEALDPVHAKRVRRGALFYDYTYGHTDLPVSKLPVDETEGHEGSVDQLWSEIGEALAEHAPPNAYFGSHEGDGADIGFWFNADL